MRTLCVTLAVVALIAPAHAQSGYEFEALPDSIDGTALGRPLAIANDAAILLWRPATDHERRYGIYKNGRLDSFELPIGPPLDLWIADLTDLNARHDLVGNNWTFRVPYSGYIGRGFIRDPRGRLEGFAAEAESTGLNGINDHGVAAGFLITCVPETCFCPIEWCMPIETTIAMVVVDGEAIPLDIPHADPFDISTAIAIDDAGRILGWRAPGPAPWPKTYFLLDDGRFEVIAPPDVPGAASVELFDLNNRGQILGRWLDAEFRLPHGFLREPDGQIVPIEWTRSWPDVIQHRMPAGEIVTMRLLSTGTRVQGFNDSGQVLASAQAFYEGRLANGSLYRQLEEVHGIGRKGGRP